MMSWIHPSASAVGIGVPELSNRAFAILTVDDFLSTNRMLPCYFFYVNFVLLIHTMNWVCLIEDYMKEWNNCYSYGGFPQLIHYQHTFHW